MADSSANDTSRGTEIRENAFALLMEKGYAKTSYADIARASNCTRALVQYYFPKKTLIMDQFTTRLLELSEQYATEHSLITGSQFVDMHTTGSMHFHFLLKNEGLMSLTRDIVSSRDHSAAVIEIMAEWQRRFSTLDDISDSDIIDAVLLAVGGAYELIGHHLNRGIDIDINRLLARTIRTYIVNLGLDPNDFMEYVGAHRLSEEDLVGANTFILTNMVQL